MKKGRWFRWLLLILFLAFLGLYYSSNAGIIDYQARRRKNLTEKQIKQFEDDIKNNREVDINKYIDTNDKNYDNTVSRTTLKVSNTIGEVVDDVLNFMFKKVIDMKE